MLGFNEIVWKELGVLNMTVNQLAQEVGISPQYLYALLRGDTKHRWNEDIFSKVCKVLKIDVEYKVS